MASVIASVVSINILPYILVAIKSNFLKFDVSNIQNNIYLLGKSVTPLVKELPPLQKRLYFSSVGLSVCLFVCLFCGRYSKCYEWIAITVFGGILGCTMN